MTTTVAGLRTGKRPGEAPAVAYRHGGASGGDAH
jgi:hypothetical protein